jgi:hypothetical protein
MPEVIKDIIKPRVSICSVCPPDENGYVSLGANVDYIGSTIDYCEVKIAQVNKYVPRTNGGAVRHISEFTHLVEIDAELPEVRQFLLPTLKKQSAKTAHHLLTTAIAFSLASAVFLTLLPLSLHIRKIWGFTPKWLVTA